MSGLAYVILPRCVVELQGPCLQCLTVETCQLPRLLWLVSKTGQVASHRLRI